jgi:hypothetical protein
MNMTWHHLPAPARTIAVAAVDAIDATREQDSDRFDASVHRLTTVDGTGLVLGGVVRLLLEDHLRDGLDSEDIRRIIDDCVAANRGWQPSVDPDILLVLLAGALGIHDRDEDAAPIRPDSLAQHTALLIARLSIAAPRPIEAYLTSVFAEIERGELHD